VDYGRQIELPGDMPAPAAASARPAPALTPAPIAGSAPAPADRPLSTASQQTIAAVAPAGLKAAAELARANLSGPSLRPAPTAAAETEAPGTSTIVVPVTLPVAGQSAEIVIRIVLKAAP
jgi:hypothetical protein